MSPGLKYFIENYSKITKPDGGLESITLSDAQLDFINQMEEAEKRGERMMILKGRTKYHFGFSQPPSLVPKKISL